MRRLSSQEMKWTAGPNAIEGEWGVLSMDRRRVPSTFLQTVFSVKLLQIVMENEHSSSFKFDFCLLL